MSLILEIFSGQTPPATSLAYPLGTKGLVLPRQLVWSRVDWLISLLAVSLFAIGAQLLWLHADMVVPWDSKNQFYPFFRFLSDSLRNGDSPFWNPYHFGGHPSIADPQSLIFTPSMLLAAWLLPDVSMQGFDAIIMAHLALGAFAVLGLCERRGWHPAAAILAAIIYMLAGSPAARLQHTGMIISYAFFPCALWALEVMLKRRSYWAAALFGAFAALMAEGRDQVAYLFCLAIIALVLCNIAMAPKPWIYLRQRLGLFALALLISAGLLAVPVLLTLQFLVASNRPGISYGVAATGSLMPVNFLTMIAPNIFGTLDWNYDYWGPGYETTVEPNWTDRAINYLFIGTLPALLVFWQGLTRGHLWDRPIRFFTFMATLAALYAVGRYTPFFGLIFDHLPGASLYRRPADATFAFNFAMAMVSGYLLHRYIDLGLDYSGVVGRLRLIFAAFVGAVFAWLTYLAIDLAYHFGHLRETLLALGLAVCMGALLGFALSLARNPQRRGWLAAALVIFTMGELFWRDAASSLNAEPTSAYSILGQPTAVEQSALQELKRELAARADKGERTRVEILGMAGPWQNASMLLKLEDTLGYNPLRIAAYERAVGPGENAGDPNFRQFPGTFRGYRSKLASLLGLEYLILDRPLAKLPRRFPRPYATPIFSSDHLYIYRLGEVTPRVYFALQALPIESEMVLQAQEMPLFDRARQVLIEQGDIGKIDASLTQPLLDASGTSNVSLRAYHNDLVVVETDSDRPGVLVLHDLYYPGWKVRVDGKEATLLHSNLIFRGVEVPQGHHIVEFSFEPLAMDNLWAAASELIKSGED